MSTPSKPWCSCDLAQIKESGLFGLGRLAIIEAEMGLRTGKAFTVDGQPLVNCACVTLADGKRYLYTRLDDEWGARAMERDLLVAVLDPTELKLVNDDCFHAQRVETDLRRFEKAVKVSWRDWNDGVFLGDDYHSSVDEAMDQWVSDNGDWKDRKLTADSADLPTHLWPATPQQVITGRELSDMLENAVSDRGWEDCSEDDLNGMADLQAAFDRFVAANTSVVSYTPDYTRAILLEGVLDEEVKS